MMAHFLVNAILLLAASRLALAGDVPAAAVTYRVHCAPCHGTTGRGDGPWADAFDPRPSNLRAGFIDRHEPDELVRRILDGQGRRLGLEPNRLQRQADQVESLVTHLRKLPDIDWDSAERGEALYVAHCETCHGRFGRPGSELPPGVRQPRDLSDPTFQRGTSDENLIRLVRHGRRGMPAIPAMRSEDPRPLVAYVRLLSPGFETYTRYCAACHGDDGRADQLVEPGAAPLVRFDRAWVARQDPEALRTKVWHMLADKKPRMPHFRGRLDEGQVRAIVEYLRRE